MVKVFEQGDPNPAFCRKTGVFFLGSWRNFAFVYSAMLFFTWKYPWAPAPLSRTTRSGILSRSGMRQFPDEVNILQEDWVSLSCGEGVLVIGNRNTLICSQGFLSPGRSMDW
jgi:hypothetical protein